VRESANEYPVSPVQAYLVSCVNSRASDIAEAAAILKGKRVAEVSNDSRVAAGGSAVHLCFV
jgi:homoaconitase/3-isopropylmalate dehydratase large subunit